jgi:hypothetical protein
VLATEPCNWCFSQAKKISDKLKEHERSQQQTLLKEVLVGSAEAFTQADYNESASFRRDWGSFLAKLNVGRPDVVVAMDSYVLNNKCCLEKMGGRDGQAP